MVNYIQIELLKLRRKKFLWLMLASSVIMPLITIFYYRSSIREIDALRFFQWSAFSYTPWIILPIVLGVLCIMLIHDEHENDMFKLLWIIPVNRTVFFLSKFFIVMFYSIFFMMLAFIASVLVIMLLGIPLFHEDIVLFLLIKCLEIGFLAPIAMLPILSMAVAQKGYIFPVCATLVYTFLGFVLLLVNMYHSSAFQYDSHNHTESLNRCFKRTNTFRQSTFMYFPMGSSFCFFAKISLNKKES